MKRIEGLFAYALDALLPALALSALVMAGLALAGYVTGRRPGRWTGWAQLRLILPTSFFLALALTPLPDPAQLDCSAGGWEPQLRPFRFLIIFNRLDPSHPIWASDVLIVSTVMNFLLCAVIGMALAGLARRAWQALLFGTVLSLGVELSQITGLWGIYPCPYRQFDVDDLILNISGVMVGFLAMRASRRRKQLA